MSQEIRIALPFDKITTNDVVAHLPDNHKRLYYKLTAGELNTDLQLRYMRCDPTMAKRAISEEVDKQPLERILSAKEGQQIEQLSLVLLTIGKKLADENIQFRSQDKKDISFDSPRRAARLAIHTLLIHRDESLHDFWPVA